MFAPLPATGTPSQSSKRANPPVKVFLSLFQGVYGSLAAFGAVLQTAVLPANACFGGVGAAFIFPITRSYVVESPECGSSAVWKKIASKETERFFLE